MKEKALSLILAALLLISAVPVAVAAGGTAYASTQEITLNGEKVVLQAYALKDANGYDTNYVKARDVAWLLNGTGARFAVDWDGAVNLLTGQPYTANGSEMSTPFSGNRSYKTAVAVTKVDGVETALEAITLTDDQGGGYTYYKLRDMADALGFTVEWVPGTGIVLDTPELTSQVDFYALLADVSARHKDLVETPIDNTALMSCLVTDAAAANLLSDAEIAALLEDHSRPEMITYEQAVADVDLFFRAFASAYGGYYYFGESAWQEAENEIMAWLNGKSSVSRTQFETALCSAMDFLQDAHVSIGGTDRGLELEYEYYYCEGQDYRQDEAGYYKTVNGERWYFVSFSDERVSLERSLTAEGEIVYSPVLLCPEPDMKSCAVTLKSASGKTKTETIAWIRNESYWGGYYPDTGYQYIEEDGIAYISLRSCSNYYRDILEEYAASGSDARDASLIVFDIRGNSGGSELYSTNWIVNFIGYGPSLPLAGGTRYSKLRTATGFDNGNIAAGTFESYRVSGRWIENDIPIIVLVDEYVASAGESTLNYLRAMDNVIVVGSNTTGAQLCGNVMGLTLPNSGTHFSFGSGIGFQYDTTNKDFRGYEPDIWCNPKTSLDAVMNMVELYGLVDADAASNMGGTLDDAVAEKSTIVLKMVMHPAEGVLVPDLDLYPGEHCGMPEVDASQVWQVYKDGVARNDFTVVSANSDIVKVTKLYNPADSSRYYGMFEARTMSRGTAKFYVTVDGETAEFVWFAG